MNADYLDPDGWCNATSIDTDKDDLIYYLQWLLAERDWILDMIFQPGNKITVTNV